MFLYNTTFSVMPKVEKEFLIWMRCEVLPSMMRKTEENEKEEGNPCPCLYKIEANDPDNMAYAMHLMFESRGAMDDYRKNEAIEMRQDMIERFGSDVLTFSTLMEKIG